LQLPDSRLDYGAAKVRFDQIIDHKTDAQAITTQLTALRKAALDLAGQDAPDNRKLAALQHVIYDAGPWNGGRAFAYDLSDPLGRKPGNQLLSTYLRTRLGNCVSMPSLHLILADRMGVKGVSLVEAPLHLFVRYTDPTGKAYNLETTSGAHVTRDVWYREKLPMSDRSVESGLYMRSLTRREAVADFAMPVVENLIDARRYHDAVAVAQVILDNAPRNGHAMVKQATAYAGLIDTEFVEKYPDPNTIPPVLVSRYKMLAAKNQALFKAAEALGWTPVE